MINFRLIFWFLEYVTYIYGKGSSDEFDQKVSNVMNMIWDLKKEYNEMTKGIPF